MKQVMIDMMSAMMPIMRPLFYVAAGAALLGIVFGISGRAVAADRLGFVVLAGAGFLLACEIAGRLLGFEPTILFAAPLDRAMYRNQWPFWVLGIGLGVTGAAIRYFAARREGR